MAWLDCTRLSDLATAVWLGFSLGFALTWLRVLGLTSATAVWISFGLTNDAALWLGWWLRLLRLAMALATAVWLAFGLTNNSAVWLGCWLRLFRLAMALASAVWLSVCNDSIFKILMMTKNIITYYQRYLCRTPDSSRSDQDGAKLTTRESIVQSSEGGPHSP